MADFFNKLYSIPNFTTYLLIVIGVLVVIFILILFLGKKDQKLEETKRLEALTQDGFKEVINEPLKLEAPLENTQEESPELLVATVPNKEEEVVLDTSPIIKVLENEEKFKASDVPKIEEIPNLEEPMEELEIPKEEIKPIFEATTEVPIINVPVEESNPEPVKIVIPDAPVIKEEIKIEADNNLNQNIELEEEKKVEFEKIPEVEIPEFNFEDLTNSLNEEYQESKVEKPRETEDKKFEPSKVFSSVYVAKPENNVEEKTELPKETIDEDEFELPKLKEEVKETKVLEPVTFDTLSGETYNIK